MADEGLDNLSEGEEAPAPVKKGGGGFIVGLLKWIAIGIGGIVLIAVISIIVVKSVGGSSSNAAPVDRISDDYKVKREVLDWYRSLDEIRTKTNDDPSGTVTVAIALGYKKDDKAVSTEITQRNIELIDFLRRYFTEKTMLELEPRNETNLKIELRNAINDEILSNSKIKDIAFTKFDVLKP